MSVFARSPGDATCGIATRAEGEEEEEEEGDADGTVGLAEGADSLSRGTHLLGLFFSGVAGVDGIDGRLDLGLPRASRLAWLTSTEAFHGV